MFNALSIAVRPILCPDAVLARMCLLRPAALSKLLLQPRFWHFEDLILQDIGFCEAYMAVALSRLNFRDPTCVHCYVREDPPTGPLDDFDA